MNSDFASGQQPISQQGTIIVQPCRKPATGNCQFIGLQVFVVPYQLSIRIEQAGGFQCN